MNDIVNSLLILSPSQHAFFFGLSCAKLMQEGKPTVRAWTIRLTFILVSALIYCALIKSYLLGDVILGGLLGFYGTMSLATASWLLEHLKPKA